MFSNSVTALLVEDFWTCLREVRAEGANSVVGDDIDSDEKSLRLAKKAVNLFKFT